MKTIDWDAAFRGCTSARERAFVGQMKKTGNSSRSFFTVKQWEYLCDLEEKGAPSGRGLDVVDARFDPVEERVSVCSYDGCEWEGTGSDWWEHAHENHGRSLPHWMTE